MSIDAVVWVGLTFVAMSTVGVLTGSIKTNGTTDANPAGPAALALVGIALLAFLTPSRRLGDRIAETTVVRS